MRFTVPADAVNPTMTFSLKADNFAEVSINGASAGGLITGQADQVNVDAVFSQNVHVGENTITLNIGDEGGLNGFNFRIDLTMQSSEPIEIVPTDPDTDGDGVTDAHDAFPNDPNETTDTDNDGTGDNADDFDNDPNETTDSDGDGVGDNGDAFPGDPLETTDSDGDGAGDNADAFDNDPTETTDTDGDGVGNNADAFDNDPTETKDTDGDGHGDNGDLYPTNPAVWSNQAPVAVNDAHTGQWNTVMNIAAPGVKANDSDLGDGAAVLTVSQVAAPSHGALTLNADGSFTYKPVANYAGTDSFTYKLTDPFNVQSNIATVVLTITSPCAPKKKKHHHHYKGDGDDHDRGRNGHRKGDRCDHDRDGDGHRHDDDDDDDDDDVVCAAGMPKTNKDNYSMKQWSTLSISAKSGVRKNDGKTPTTIELVSTTSRGTLTLAADGSFVYKSAPGFTGTDSFRYIARTMAGVASDVELVTIQVTKKRGNEDDCSYSDHDRDHDRDRDWSHRGSKYKGSKKHDHDEDDDDREWWW